MMGTTICSVKVLLLTIWPRKQPWIYTLMPTDLLTAYAYAYVANS